MGDALVVMGVSGSGKTTIARLLAEQLGLDVAEADDFHPAANIERMTHGTALTDSDRWPWLHAVRDWLDSRPGGAVVTCSALKRSYRDLLRAGSSSVRFIQLDAPADLLLSRMTRRSGHFAPPALLGSQLADLEPLHPDEDGVVVSAVPAPDQVVIAVLAALGLRA